MVLQHFKIVLLKEINIFLIKCSQILTCTVFFIANSNIEMFNQEFVLNVSVCVLCLYGQFSHCLYKWCAFSFFSFLTIYCPSQYFISESVLNSAIWWYMYYLVFLKENLTLSHFGIFCVDISRSTIMVHVLTSYFQIVYKYNIFYFIISCI